MRVLATVAPIACLMLSAQVAEATPSGQWILRVDRMGSPEYSTLTLVERRGVLSGDWDGDAVTGTLSRGEVRFAVRDERGGIYVFAGRLASTGMVGTADYPDNNHPDRRLKFNFTARRLPDRPAGGPRVLDYRPLDYSNSFSAEREAVLTVWPGDTIRTTTVDAGGMDKSGATVALFGNPQTGPFFIVGAQPGDTLAIHIRKLSPNRDWADSLDSIVPRAYAGASSAQAAQLGKPIRWRLDRVANTASPEGAGPRLANLKIPIRPMLGGLALAPGFTAPPLSTGDTGRAGGNMDFPEVVQGNTVLLPVQQPGALLYLGDGHAAQGDGETSQYALETSMDVEITVDLIKGRTIQMPRVESPTELMVLGQAGSLDEALKAASTGMIRWLQIDYGLTLSEAAQVMGAGLRYSVPNLAGRSVGVAARIDRALLPDRLPPAP